MSIAKLAVLLSMIVLTGCCSNEDTYNYYVMLEPEIELEIE
jgi:hypothetical protein